MSDNSTTNWLIVALIVVIVAANKHEPGIVLLQDNLSTMLVVGGVLLIAAFAFMYIMGLAITGIERYLGAFERTSAWIEQRNPRMAAMFKSTMSYVHIAIVVAGGVLILSVVMDAVKPFFGIR